MKITAKSARRLLTAAVSVGLAVILTAPYLNLDRYGQQIQAVLEKELHRRVTVGSVRLDLFRGPGFSLSDVVIHDDPRVGREPLAYVTTLQIRIALRSLWMGRLEIASLRLVEPSVNLVKPAVGPWNFEQLLGRGLPERAETVPLPAILVRSGRVNFKFGDLKSVFYFANADVDILPPGPGQTTWGLRFSGEPARTDRPAQGLGGISGRGRWGPGGRLEMTLDLERSYLEEITTLLAGRDLGLRGNLASRAQLAGPVSDIRITGRAQLRDFRRWDLMPPQGGDWTFSYTGCLDLLSQQLALEASPQGALPVTLRMRISDYLSQPRWDLMAGFENLALDSAPALLRVLGLAIPPEIKLAGRASGAVGYSSTGGLAGALVAQDVSLGAPGHPTLRCARAPVAVDRGKLRLGPLVLERPDKSSVRLEAGVALDGTALGLRITSQGAWIPEQQGTGLLPGLTPVPLLEMFRGGTWRGDLRCECAGAARWAGNLELKDTRLLLEGLAHPVQVEQARLRLAPDGSAIQRLRGALGKSTLEAQYFYRAKAPRPHQFQVSLGELDLAELEKALAPTLDRRQNLLARALKLGRAPAPDWLRKRKAQGEFTIASVAYGGAATGPVSGRLRWDGPNVEILDLRVRLAEATLAGRLAADLRGAAPVYRLSGALGSLVWGGGRWDAEGYVETSGLGDELLENLRAEGAFLGRAVELAPEEKFDFVAGRFTLKAGRQPQLKIEGLEAIQSEVAFRGECRVLPDGRLSVELRGGHKQLRLAGTVWPLKLEPVATR